MMYRDRTTVGRPAALAGVDSRATRERTRAETVFGEGGTGGKFDFAVYRDEEVKARLEELFFGKCAYCESKYIVVQPMDVEHYRPKGGYIVDGKLQKPGYWWLAADWENLLPSCIDCNRKRTHQLPDDGERSFGKENLFPLLDEARRAKRPGEEKDERPLLLHPCRPEPRPEDLLDFGDEGVIKAKPELTGYRQELARTSIEVYGLDRPKLTQARSELWRRILGQYGKVLDELEDLEADLSSSEQRRRLAEALTEFLAFREPDQEYALMARCHIDPVVDDIEEELEWLLGAELAADGKGERFLDTFLSKYSTLERLDPRERMKRRIERRRTQA